MNESDLIEVIEFYYENKKKDFLAAIYRGGFPKKVLNSDEEPQTVYTDFVHYCRGGLDESGRRKVFESLCKDMPGCAEFISLAKSSANTFPGALFEIYCSIPKAGANGSNSGDRKREAREAPEGSKSRPSVSLDDCRLNIDETDCMIEVAVAPHKDCRQICWNPIATHAAGAAVASWAVSTFLATIEYVTLQFINRGHEMLIESSFNKDTLVEYLCHLRRPLTLLISMTGSATEPKATEEEEEQQQRMTGIALALTELREGSSLCDRIKDIHKELQTEVMSEMTQLIQYISDREQKDTEELTAMGKEAFQPKTKAKLKGEAKKWNKEKEDKIEMLFRAKASSLLLLVNRCSRLLFDGRAYTTDIRQDWHSNVNEIRRHCEQFTT